MTDRLFKDPDSELIEYMTREYGINFIRARNIAREIKFDQFGENLEKDKAGNDKYKKN